MELTRDQIIKMIETNGGDLNLSNLPVTKLPSGLHVPGSMILAHTPLTTLPRKLHVEKDLDLKESSVTELPDDLIVGGRLKLRNSQISTLPSRIDAGVIDCAWMPKVKVPAKAQYTGDLILDEVKEVKLGQGLQIGGDLSLCSAESPTALPAGLHIGGSLKLSYSAVEEIGADTIIDGDLNLADTKVKSMRDGITIGGKLKIRPRTSVNRAWFVPESQPELAELPSRLRVGSLIIWGSKITELPEDLTVINNLRIGDEIKHIPLQLDLTGNLNAWRIDSLKPGGRIGGKADFGHSTLTEVESLTVGGTADFGWTQLRALTGNCKIGGDLLLPTNSYIELPDGLEVGGTLRVGTGGRRLDDYQTVLRLPRKLRAGALELHVATIESWPEELELDSGISIAESNITELPETLTEVNGDLLLNSVIDRLPDSLEVINGSLYTDVLSKRLGSLGSGPLQINGDMEIWSTQLVELPENLTVRGHCALYRTQIAALPQGMTVGGDLYLDESITEPFPQDLEVKGNIVWKLAKHYGSKEFEKILAVINQAVTDGWKVSKETLKTIVFCR